MNFVKILLKFFISSCCFCYSHSLPTIDPGVFVLQGVPSCRQGKGYCVLGTNCSIDKDFEFDNEGGHCNEVTKSFTSLLSFVCCRFVKDKQEGEEDYHTTNLPFTIKEEKFQVLDQNPIPLEDEYDSIIPENEDPANLVDIVGVVTDFTGIINLVTRPYQPSSSSTSTPTVSSTQITAASFESVDSSQVMSSTAQYSSSTESISNEPFNENSILINEADAAINHTEVISSSSISSLIDEVNLKSSTISPISTSSETHQSTIEKSNEKLNISTEDIDDTNISFDDNIPLPKSSDQVISTSADTNAEATGIISDAVLTNNPPVVNVSDDTVHSMIIIKVTKDTTKNTNNNVTVKAITNNDTETSTTNTNNIDNIGTEHVTENSTITNTTNIANNVTKNVSTNSTNLVTENSIANTDTTISFTERAITNADKETTVNTSLTVVITPNNMSEFNTDGLAQAADINPDFINQILPSLLTTNVPKLKKITSTNTITILPFTNESSTPLITESIGSEGLDISSSIQSNELIKDIASKEKESHNNYRNTDETKTSVSNEAKIDDVQVLNLPEAIRNFLAKIQSEKQQKNENTNHSSDIKASEDIISNVTTTTTTTTKSVIDPTDGNVDNDVITTTLTSVTETSGVSTFYPILKPSPYVPPMWEEIDQDKIKKENEKLNTAFLFNEENGHTWTGMNELVTTTYKTTSLHKHEGPNVIDMGSEKKENEEEEFEENVLPHPINLNICGLKSPNLMLSEHARAASTYDWCWSAALMRKEGRIDRFECSGTLIELDLVVTTAACLKRLRSKDLSNYRIVVGDSNLRDELPYGVQYLDIDEIVTHPDYLTSGGAHANDIGIIRLRELATLDHNVCLACVAQRNAYIPSHTCVVSGYTLGDIPQDIRRDVEGFTPMEGILRESLVNIQKSSDCQSSVRRLSPNPLLVADPRSFLCDVKRKSARSCTNTLDGGSPLVCEVGGRWFLAGIASWSRDCSSDPNIYTRVSSFSDWFLNTRLRMYGFVSHRL